MSGIKLKNISVNSIYMAIPLETAQLRHIYPKVNLNDDLFCLSFLNLVVHLIVKSRIGACNIISFVLNTAVPTDKLSLRN